MTKISIVSGAAAQGGTEPARVSLVILPCPTCGRAVQVFGRVRRVLCACGEVLMEIDGRASSSGPGHSSVEAR